MAGSEAVESTRVVIADDHPLFRAGIRERLTSAGIEVVGEAADGGEACDLVERLRPDVAILDISMPGLNGIEATRRIKAEWPEVGVLVLTVYDDEQYVYALVDAGAAGYLLKTAEATDVADAVVRIRQGEAVLSPSVTEKVLRRLTQRATPAPTSSRCPLSERELEVLRLAARGRSNKAIADALPVSVRTVHAHMRHIFNKLDVASRTEAVTLAVREGWLRLDELA